jgi:hypothetical protein
MKTHGFLICVLTLCLTLPGWGCSETTATDGGGGDDGGGGGQLDSAGAGVVVGSGTVIPRGKPAQGPLKLGWWTTLGSDGGEKAVPQTGRFNGDFYPDLMLNARKTQLYYYEAQGKGAFAKPVKLGSGIFAGGWNGDVGDINRDRKLDVAFGDHVLGGRAFLGDGKGGFADASPSHKGTFSGAGLGDLDGDGDLDLVLGADQFASGLAVFLNDGTGSWTEVTPPGLDAYAGGMGSGKFSNVGYFAFVDLDRDRDLDLFAFGQMSGSFGVVCRVYRNDGKGARWTRVADLGGGVSAGIGSPVQGSVGDVDGNGYPDVASGGTIHLNKDGKTFEQGVVVDSAKISHLADMDGDGKLDLVTHDRSTGLKLYLGDGSGKKWTADDKAGLPDASKFPPGAPVTREIHNAYGIEIADLDNSGSLDVLRVVVAKEPQVITNKYGAYLEAWLR